MLDRVLRLVSKPWIHMVTFFVLFTLLPAILFSVSSPDSWVSALGFSALPGCCAAVGRVVAFRSVQGGFQRDMSAM
ncbi:hypothetical protein CQ018_03020 [Arthrobacter sp. MYb227]|nr:hypothetical protein CQ018_03020 [Arthrobacter sp. MYb227]